MRILRKFFSRIEIVRAPLAAFAVACLFAGAALAQPALEARSAQPPNIDALKQQLLAYKSSGDYERGLAAVAARAQAYVEAHAAGVTKPALVLDIDETSLSNWPRIVADDFGYIPSGACNRLPKGPCGAKAWEIKGEGAGHRADAEAVQRRAGQRRQPCSSSPAATKTSGPRRSGIFAAPAIAAGPVW